MTDRVKRLKETYPPGTRLELLHMDDPYHPVPDGTKGTVKHVDDDGQLHMMWDNGRTLAVNTEVDTIRKLTMDEIAEEEIAKGHSVVNLGWRLQGFTDEQFRRAEATGLKDSHLYKMAGNAVSVPVITAIGRRLKILADEYQIIDKE